MDRVLPTPTKLDLTSHFSAESTTRITLGAFVIPSALHLRAKDVREPLRSDAALWHRNKREVTFHIALCRERRVSSQSARFCSRHQRPPPAYFNFTNNKTKIAHTPTVIGNCAKAASRTGPPLGSANVRKNITSAVSIPTTNLLFQFMDVPPRHATSPTSSHRPSHTSAQEYTPKGPGTPKNGKA